MTKNGNAPTTLGFLTVVSDPELGLLGGYLALNAAGRPLEFHCTAPVKASRAQEILYGTALAPYLYGELIGGTLAARAKTPPLLICTDTAPVLALRAATDAPVVLILPDADQAAAAAVLATGVPGETRSAPAARLVMLPLGKRRAALDAAHAEDRRIVEAVGAGPFADFDFAEPFARIREALEEARPTGSAAKPPRPIAGAA
jgi:hypothetical protein